MLGSNTKPKVKKATKLTHQAHISHRTKSKTTNKMLGKLKRITIPQVTKSQNYSSGQMNRFYPWFRHIDTEDQYLIIIRELLCSFKSEINSTNSISSKYIFLGRLSNLQHTFKVESKLKYFFRIFSLSFSIVAELKGQPEKSTPIFLSQSGFQKPFFSNPLPYSIA